MKGSNYVTLALSIGHECPPMIFKHIHTHATLPEMVSIGLYTIHIYIDIKLKTQLDDYMTRKGNLKLVRPVLTVVVIQYLLNCHL